VQPVVQRELLEESRRKSLWMLRAAGAVVPMAALWLRGSTTWAHDGSMVFGRMNAALLTFCWLVGPVLTADCLSRERREGTLGLLFLTPLRAREVVLAKAFAVMLRAGSVLAAALPMLALPVLMGGVGWMDLARMACTIGASLLVALAAGLLASSWCTHWLRVRLGSAAVSLAAAGLFGAMYELFRTFSFVLTWRGMPRGRSVTDIWLLECLNSLGRVGLGPYAGPLIWFEGMGSHTTATTLTVAAVHAAAGGVLAGVVILFAAWVLEHSWRPAAANPMVERFADIMTQRSLVPVLAGRIKRRVMEISPALWMQNLSWQARVASFVTLGAVAMFFVPYVTYRRPDEADFQLAAFGVMLLASVIGAASFRAEKESGALELLLTSGISPAELARARIAAVCVHVLPAAVLLSGVFMYLWNGAYSGSAYHWGAIWTCLEVAPWTCAVAALAVGLSTSGFSLAGSVAISLAARFATMLFAKLVNSLLSDQNYVGSDEQASYFEAFFSVVGSALTAFVGWRVAETGLSRRRFLGKIV
jgi:ABC-type transport system involved in multi-copper enzyme maturation permease subunit